MGAATLAKNISKKVASICWCILLLLFSKSVSLMLVCLTSPEGAQPLLGSPNASWGGPLCLSRIISSKNDLFAVGDPLIWDGHLLLEAPLFFLMRHTSTWSAPVLLGRPFAAGESPFLL